MCTHRQTSAETETTPPPAYEDVPGVQDRRCAFPEPPPYEQQVSTRPRKSFPLTLSLCSLISN